VEDMASNLTTLPPPHSKRVEAWIYTALNPLIESLRREIFLLEKGNLSWRWYSRKCEYLRPVTEYVDYAHQPNFEDFLADGLNAVFKGKFESHDLAVAEVESRVNKLYDILLAVGSIFRENVQERLEEYEKRIGDNPQSPSLISMRKDFPNYIAEYIINNVQTIPPHYPIHTFWELSEEFFRGLADASAWHKSFVAMKAATSDMLRISSQLVSDLENHRFDLCRTYDIPAAPIFVKKSQSSDETIV